MRRAARLDANHNDVREYVEANGYSVVSLAPMGRNIPDLLVGRSGFSALVEVKNPDAPPSKQKLREGQQKFRDWWRGVVITALSGPHALAQLEAWRAKLCKPYIVD